MNQTVTKTDCVLLSPREFQVIVRLAKGWKISQICADIGISESFSANLRHNAYKKLGIKSAKELPLKLKQTTISMPAWWILGKNEKSKKTV